MAKDKDLEPVVTKLVELVKNHDAKLKEIENKFDKYTDAYLEGIKEGIVYMQKQK